MQISKEAFDLIVREEVSSKALYEKRYRHPEWPGVQSGVTIGIGYDVGQTAAATVRADWTGRIPAAAIEALVATCGITGLAAKAHAQRLRSIVDVPWDVALAVHQERVLPRWIAKVQKALPNTEKLSPDCLGALVSLTFNRGPSFSNAGERYKEMRAIKAAMASENFAAIPAQFRAMKRLWPGVTGLQKRRDTEAALFEKGLRTRSAPLPEPVPIAPAETPKPAPLPDKPVETKSAPMPVSDGKKQGAVATGILGLIAAVFIGAWNWLTDHWLELTIYAAIIGGLTYLGIYRYRKGRFPWTSTGVQLQEPLPPTPQRSEPSSVPLSAHLAVSLAALPETPLPESSELRQPRKRSARPSGRTRRRSTSSKGSRPKEGRKLPPKRKSKSSALKNKG